MEYYLPAVIALGVTAICTLWIWHSVKERNKIISDFNRLVEGAVDFEAGVKFSAAWLRATANQMEKDEGFKEVAPLIGSLENALLDAAKVQR